MNLSLFAQLYPRKWGQHCIKELCNLSLEIQGPFMGEGALPYVGNVGRFRGDDPHFCDCRSNLVLIVWCNQIDPLFLQKKSVCVYHI